MKICKILMRQMKLNIYSCQKNHAIEQYHKTRQKYSVDGALSHCGGINYYHDLAEGTLCLRYNRWHLGKQRSLSFSPCILHLATTEVTAV